MKRLLNRIYIVSVAVVTLVALVYVYAAPLGSMQVTRDGISHFSPQVINPATGEAVDLAALVRNYRGD